MLKLHCKEGNNLVDHKYITYLNSVWTANIQGSLLGVNMNEERTTLKDIAEQLGVSISTVSRALRGDTRVAEATRQRVTLAARELAYPLIPINNGITLGQIHVLILDASWGRFFDETINELVRQSEKRGCEVAVYRVERYEPLCEGLARVANLTNGVIVVGTWEPLGNREIEIISSLSVPVILINRYLETTASSVTLDDYGAGVLAANYLADLGHQHIAYLPGRELSSSMRDRARGFISGLQSLNLYRPELFTKPLTGNILEWACESVSYLFSLPQPPTAIWACNDVAASAVIVAARTQGFRTPEQISVMGFDHTPQAREIGLTTFDYRLTELGRYVTYLAEEWLHGAIKGPVRINVMPQLIEGITTGPVSLEAKRLKLGGIPN